MIKSKSRSKLNPDAKPFESLRWNTSESSSSSSSSSSSQGHASASPKNGIEEEKFERLKWLAIKLSANLIAVKCVDDLFSEENSTIRRDMGCTYESLMFSKKLGLKAWRMLWRTYYTYISYGKKECTRAFNSYKLKHEQIDARDILCHKKLPICIFTDFYNMKLFLISAIQDFQYLIIKFCNKYNIKLKYYLNGFKFLKNFNNEPGKFGMYILDEGTLDAYNSNVNENVSAPESDQQYGFEILSIVFVAVGDLHRYITALDLNAYMNNPTEWIDINDGDNNCGIITYVSSANLRFINMEYIKNIYFTAFELNPSNGLAQNLMGTLVVPQNNGVDAVFHYIHAIYHKQDIPAKTNLRDLFVTNTNKIIANRSIVTNSGCYSTIEDLHLIFILIIDIAYNKKKTEDLQCNCSNFIQTMPYFLELGLITENCLLKMIGIILMCMEEVDISTSYLKALLFGIGFCMVKSCNNNYVKYVGKHTEQELAFNRTYMNAFQAFKNTYKAKRTEYRLHKRAFRRYQQKHKNNIDEKRKMDQYKNDLLLKKPTLPSFSSPLPSTSPNQALLNEVIHPVYITATGAGIKMHKIHVVKDHKKKANQMKFRRRRRVRVRHSSNNYNSSSDECDLSMEKETNVDLLPISGSSRDEYTDMPSDYNTFKGSSNQIPCFRDDEHDDYDHDDYNDTYDDDTEDQPLTQDEQDDIREQEELLEAAADASEIYSNAYENDNSDEELSAQFQRKKSYIKMDPNIIIKFAMSEPTLKGLKILFDWIKSDQEAFNNIYVTNPEFVHETIKLINYLHLDIFSDVIYFNRAMLDIPHLRNDLDTLANNNSMIPLHEDRQLKHLSIIKDSQCTLDWHSPIDYNTTQNEETVLRLIKIGDFGHYISEKHAFEYNFCSIARTFMLNIDIELAMASQIVSGESEEYNINEQRDTEHHQIETLVVNHQELEGVSQVDVPEDDVPPDVPEPTKSESNKPEIMRRLWLEHEVRELERKLQAFGSSTSELDFHPTPYVVVDSASIASYFNLVRNVIEKENCIVLIPLTVLSELDNLKKKSAQARKAIKYFEIQFRDGNRFVRVQNPHERVTIPTGKAVTKLDRKSLEYLHIAQFCKCIIESEKKNNYDDPSHIITLLTGQPMDAIPQSKTVISLLNSVAVNYREITKF